MNKSSHAIGKQHVDLARINNFSDLAKSECRVHHCLARSISTSSIVGRSPFCRRLLRPLVGPGATLKCTSLSALGTTYSRNLSSLSNGDDDVAAHLITRNTKLFDTLANCKHRLLH